MQTPRKYRPDFLAARTTRDQSITRILVHVSVARDFMSGEGSLRLEQVRQSLQIFTREKDHANMQKAEGLSEAEPAFASGFDDAMANSHCCDDRNTALSL